MTLEFREMIVVCLTMGVACPGIEALNPCLDLITSMSLLTCLVLFLPNLDDMEVSISAAEST